VAVSLTIVTARYFQEITYVVGPPCGIYASRLQIKSASGWVNLNDNVCGPCRGARFSVPLVLRFCLKIFPMKFSGTESGKFWPISSSTSCSYVVPSGTSEISIRGHRFLMGTAFSLRSFRTLESASCSTESQRDSRRIALSFNVTILSTRIP
jgi:hypothetical protein